VIPLGGKATAIDGHMAIVGSAGHVQLRRWRGPTLGWVQEFDQIDPVPLAGVGTGVDLEDGRAVLGEPRADDGDVGRVYVRLRSSDGTWSFHQTIASPSPQPQAGFGWRVALSNNWLAISAPFEDVAPFGAETGTVYLYRLNFFHLYELIAVLHGSQAGARFGDALALSGDTLLVGAPRWRSADPAPSGTLQGSAFVYWRDGSTFVEKFQLLASDAALGDGFGSSVSLGSGRAFVGAPYRDVSSTADSGAVYLFPRQVVAPLFSDGFESGGTTAWSEVTP